MFGRIIYQSRFLLLGLFLLTTIGSLMLLPKLRIHQDFSRNFLVHDPDLKFYEKVTSIFGNDDDLLSVAVTREAGIYDSAFLNQVHDFSQAVSALSDVQHVLSLTSLAEPARTPFGNLMIPFIHLHEPVKLASDSARISRDERITNYLVSDDLKAISFTVELRASMNSTERDRLMRSLEELGAQYTFENVFISGRRFMEVTYNRLANHDFIKTLILVVVIFLITLWLLYRSVWGTVIPLVIFIVSTINVLGYFVLTGRILDTNATLYPTFIMIVSISDVVHLFSKYEEHLGSTGRRKDALIAALNEVGLTIFITSLTTAIGFLILATSPLPVIRQLGLNASFAVMLTFFITVGIVPVIFTFASERDITLVPGFNAWWSRMSSLINRLIAMHPIVVFRVALIAILLSLAMIPWINMNNKVSTAFPRHHPVNRAFFYFEEHLSGMRTIELAITTPDQGTLDKVPILREIEKLHGYLDSIPEIRKVFSPVTMYKSLNKYWSSGNPSAYRLQENDDMIHRQESARTDSSPGLFGRVLNKEKTMGKLYARMIDPGRLEAGRINDGIRQFISQQLDSSLVQLRFTGSTYMFDKMQVYSIRGLFTSLFMALGAIALVMALMFRSFKMVVITLVGNVFPLILAAGLMSLSGIELRYGTSIHFTIGFVIAVDNTIHFLANYRIQFMQLGDVKQAVASTLQKTGRAVFLTSLILLLAFSVLLFSSFRDSYIVGILVGFILLMAMVADLVLVPAMIRKFM